MDDLPPIYFSNSVSSTNDLALRGANEGAPHGACWAADEQTAGRGRREVGGERREWFSPDQSNIYLSVLLRPSIEPDRAAGLTLAAATGICSSLRFVTDLDVGIKWPNDVYINGRKVAGLLTEGATSDGKVIGIAIGLGVNVNIEQEEVPEALTGVMTSLQIESGRLWDRLQLLPALRGSILEYVDRYVEDGFSAFIDELRGYDRTNGRDVELLENGDWVRGTARGIADDGRLKVDIDGDTTLVQAGEVRFA